MCFADEVSAKSDQSGDSSRVCGVVSHEMFDLANHCFSTTDFAKSLLYKQASSKSVRTQG